MNGFMMSIPQRTIEHDKLIFVYGSNLAGVNGKGAANIAKRFLSAADGVGEGMASEFCYALPTKDKNIQTRELSDVHISIDNLMSHALDNPTQQYMMTRVGCGLAGFCDEDILPHLGNIDIPKNVLLPGIWLQKLGRLEHPRIIIAGSGSFTDAEHMRVRLENIIGTIDNTISFVSGTAQGADRLGEEFAKQYKGAFELVRFPAAWKRFKKPAGILRNAAMSWYSTHAVVFWNGQSPGSKNMAETATRDGLKVRVCHFTHT